MRSLVLICFLLLASCAGVPSNQRPHGWDSHVEYLIPSKSDLPGEFYRIDVSKPVEEWTLETELQRGGGWLDRDEGLAFFGYDQKYPDASCQQLASVQRLVSISLFRGGEMTAAGVSMLASRPNLRSVSLTLSASTSVWFEHLARNNALESLHLHEADDRLSDRQMTALSNHANLRFLTLQQCWGVKGDFLARGFASLESLSLHQIPPDTGERPEVSARLEEHIARLPSLTRVHLAQFCFARKIRLDVLLTAPRLRELTIDCMDSAVEGMERPDIATGLQVFRYTRMSNALDDRQGRSLAMTAPNIRELDLSGSILPSDLPSMLSAFKNLERLNLTNTRIEPATVRLIAASMTLKSIDLRSWEFLNGPEAKALRLEFPATEFIYP